MPQIGWLEILAIVIIAILVLGPKEFPIALKKIGSYFGKLKNTLSSELINLGLNPGIHYVPVFHESNIQGSIEEVLAIKSNKTNIQKILQNLFNDVLNIDFNLMIPFKFIFFIKIQNIFYFFCKYCIRHKINKLH